MSPLSLAGMAGDPSQLTWIAADAREHVYLGDYDSYLWVREARNYLRHGTTCDAVVDGECRDTFTNAPVGVEMRYARSLHLAAIVALHRLIGYFVPEHPLTASAFWVPVVVGVLGVVAAFAIGARLAGAVGGFAAALAIAVNPLFIDRSAGGDNDVWNVVLPLAAVWAAIAALAAPSRARGAGLAALAGAVVGLHAATWSGWIFTHLVLLAGLGVTVSIEAVAAARAGGAARARLVRAVAAFGIYWLAAAATTAIAGAGAEAVVRPFDVAWGTVAPGPPTAAVSAVPWPDVFRTVGELSRSGLGEIADALLGSLHLFAAWVGLLVLLLPERDWRMGHLVVLTGGALIYRALLATPDLGGTTLLVVLSLPLAAAVAVSFLRREASEVPRPGAYVVGVWFLAALLQAFGALRVVMLLVPPFGVLFGVAIGRLHGWLTRLMLPHVGRRAWLVPPLTLVLAGIAVAPSVRAGLAAGRSYRPAMHDAWWDTLVRLRETSPPDAIVSTWWDYGHWVKYVAERRVNADGSTLATHVPHWFGRALLAPTEEETVGLLRMLNCGSDATPAPEGRLGAWGKLVGHGVDSVTAHSIIVAVASLERREARARLREFGLAPEAADDVLESTHCVPPPTYVVLSSDMVIGSAWRTIGWWDPAREQARRLGTSPDAPPPAVPRLRYLVPRWIECTDASDATWSCRIGFPLDGAGTVLTAVEVRPDAPGETRLRMTGRDVAPAALLVAGTERVEEVALDGARDEHLGVLVDLPGRRVLVGAPDLLRSTFTRLVFLDDRLTPRFEQVDDRTGHRNERVRTWGVR